jgi:hypothetical protein
VIVFIGSTTILPDAVTDPQPPVRFIVYGYVPEVVGVPLIVTVLAAQLTVNPAGNPVKVEPVAPVVA